MLRIAPIPLAVLCLSVADLTGAGAEPPVVHHVLFHSPGPAWQDGVSFQEQPGVGEHVRYMREQLEKGLIVLGGPFLDDSGGMMICREPDFAKARTIRAAKARCVSGCRRATSTTSAGRSARAPRIRTRTSDRS